MHMFLRHLTVQAADPNLHRYDEGHLTVQAADPNLHRYDEGKQKKEGSI